MTVLFYITVFKNMLAYKRVVFELAIISKLCKSPLFSIVLNLLDTVTITQVDEWFFLEYNIYNMIIIIV